MGKATKQEPVLRRGWTTGTCAAAAAKAAYAALVTGDFPDPVVVTLPRGERPSFALAMTRIDGNAATAGVIKDAGDDPDVTHGALICATVRLGPRGSGVRFRSGAGVGTVMPCAVSVLTSAAVYLAESVFCGSRIPDALVVSCCALATRESRSEPFV